MLLEYTPIVGNDIKQQRNDSHAMYVYITCLND